MPDKIYEIDLRQIEEDDLVEMRDWRNSERVRLICREYRLLNMADQKEWFKRLQGDTTRTMFAIMETKVHYTKFIGVCGWTFIDWRSKHALLSMYIGDDDYNEDECYIAILNELHKIAFNDLGMETVRAEVYDFDPRKHIFEKAGYKTAGIWRNGYFHDGEFRDIHLKFITRKDWHNNESDISN